MSYAGKTGGRAQNRFLANQGLIQTLDTNQANIARANIGEINAGVINVTDATIVDLSAINMNVTNEFVGETIISSDATFTNTTTSTLNTAILNVGTITGTNTITQNLTCTNGTFGEIVANNIRFTGTISGHVKQNYIIRGRKTLEDSSGSVILPLDSSQFETDQVFLQNNNSFTAVKGDISGNTLTIQANGSGNSDTIDYMVLINLL